MRRCDAESETMVVTHTLKGSGFDASEDGTGRGVPLIPVLAPTLGASLDRGGTGQDAINGALIAFDETQITSKANRCNPQPGDPVHPLARGGRPPTIVRRGAEAAMSDPLAFHARQDPDHGPVTHPLDTDGASVGVLDSGLRVRSLTPKECERLQGFPDGYTAIVYRGKPAADGPRYKALGNSWAVPKMAYVGERIALINARSDCRSGSRPDRADHGQNSENSEHESAVTGAHRT